MYIADFHIDGFGIFTNAGCSDLPPGLSIFYGQNEAGKSTCLEFLRTMLTGYPEKRGKRNYEPLNGGHPGGSLTLHCNQDPHILRLSRSPEKHGGLRLHTENGDPLRNETLLRLLAGIERETYRRVFGFSLDELEQWDKRNESSILNALYGASFGPGLISPREAGEKLTKRMGDIYKPRGDIQPLAVALKELEKLRISVRQLQEERATYDALAAEHEDIQQSLVHIASQEHSLEEERRGLERRLAQWQNWNQWQIWQDKLSNLAIVPETFPEDAENRLRQLQATVNSAAINLASGQKDLEQLEDRVSRIKPDAALLAELPELQRLAERKHTYTQAASQLGAIKLDLEACREELERDLAQLGPDWTVERINRTDRSLFARESLEKLARELADARLMHTTTSSALTSINHGIEQIQVRIRDTEKDLGELPQVMASLNDNERDELRSQRSQLGRIRAEAPGRESNLEEATKEYNRCLEQAQVFGKGEKSTQITYILENLLRSQDEATSLASQIQIALQDAAEARSAVERKEEDIEDLKIRIENMQAQQAATAGPGRQVLEAKAAALRMLGKLANKITAQEDHKNEIDERIAQIRIQPALKNWTLIIISIFFLAGAATIFIAHWLYGLNELVFAEGATLPINIWAAYAAFLCGVALFAGGYSAYGPEQKRRRQEYNQLLNRSSEVAATLADLDSQARDLCRTLDIDDFHPISLEAMGMLLESEKEQLFHEESSLNKIRSLNEDLSKAQAALQPLLINAHKKDDVVQGLRLRWHHLMQGLRIVNVPSPESIATVFARAEAAKIAETNMLNAQKEVEALWENLHLTEEAITSMPAIRERLENAPEPISLEQAVEDALDSCRHADEIQQKRAHLYAILESSNQELARHGERQLQASEQLHLTDSRLKEATEKWVDHLVELGLAPEMEPETVREAYKYMQDCIKDAENIRKYERDLAHAETEIADLENPLRKLCEKLQTSPILDSNDHPDWLATLKGLLTDAEASLRQQERLEEQRDNIVNQKNRVASLETALLTAKEAERDFLASGNATDADEFLKMAHTRDERRVIRDRIQELEFILGQAAQGKDLATFLADFAQLDKDESEKRLRQIDDDLRALSEKGDKQTGEKAILSDKLATLAKSDKLGELRQEEEMLQTNIRRLANEWSNLAIADRLLKEARRNFEANRQPEIIRSASDIFAKITDGRWRGISLNLEDSSLRILPEHGDPASPAALSRGAQEQAYLALRLAYIKSHNENKESLPVIMDEILVNFDPERARRTATAMASMTEGGRQQILYFTCQPHVVEMLKDVFPEPALYKVENGSIIAA